MLFVVLYLHISGLLALAVKFQLHKRGNEKCIFRQSKINLRTPRYIQHCRAKDFFIDFSGNAVSKKPGFSPLNTICDHIVEQSAVNHIFIDPLKAIFSTLSAVEQELMCSEFMNKQYGKLLNAVNRKENLVFVDAIIENVKTKTATSANPKMRESIFVDSNIERVFTHNPTSNIGSVPPHGDLDFVHAYLSQYVVQAHADMNMALTLLNREMLIDLREISPALADKIASANLQKEIPTQLSKRIDLMRGAVDVWTSKLQKSSANRLKAPLMIANEQLKYSIPLKITLPLKVRKPMMQSTFLPRPLARLDTTHIQIPRLVF